MTRPQWKIDYEESGQYEKDKAKAKNLGHTKLSLSSCYGMTKTEELWQEKLDTRYFLPKVEKEEKVKEAWRVTYEESGQCEKDMDKAAGFGHNAQGFKINYGRTKTEETWKETLDTRYFLPKVKEEMKESWKEDYEDSGQYEKDLEKAENLGHTKISFSSCHGMTKTEEAWQEKLDAKYFLPVVKKQKKEGWRGDYEESGQYKKDMEKAKTFGHNGLSFSSECCQSKTKEEWQKKLDTKFFLPKVKKEEKVKKAWKVKYEESGQYKKDKEKAKSLGHKGKSWTAAYGRTKTEEEWQKKLDTTWFLPKVKEKEKVKEAWRVKYEENGRRNEDRQTAYAFGHDSWGWGKLYRHAKSLEDWQHTLRTFLHKQSPTLFLETWDGSVSAFFAFIDDRIQINVDLPDDFKMTYSALLDFATQVLKELGKPFKPLLEIAQSPEFVDKVVKREERRRCYEKEMAS